MAKCHDILFDDFSNHVILNKYLAVARMKWRYMKHHY